MESLLIFKWLHFSFSFQKKRKKKPRRNLTKVFLHTLSLKATPWWLQSVNFTEPFANKNRQRGSQLGTCTAPGAGKETASGGSFRGTTACSQLLLPTPPVLLLLLIHLHLSSSVFSQPHRSNTDLREQPGPPWLLHFSRTFPFLIQSYMYLCWKGHKDNLLPTSSATCPPSNHVQLHQNKSKCRVSCRESHPLTLLCLNASALQPDAPPA